MNISLRRDQYRGDGVFGHFFLENGKPFCVTLEAAYLVLGNWVPKIPSGVYVCKRYLSPHFGYEVFQIMDVPGATFIEIHIGNFLVDTHGCVCVGEFVIEQHDGNQAITNSRVTFESFMRLQDGLDQFQLTVV